MSEEIKVLINEKELDERLTEIANQINKDFASKEIILVGVLKGAVTFMVDLAKKLEPTIQFEFMDVSSYGNETISSGKITINKDLEVDIEGKNVILVEDIIDTGRTLSYLLDYLRSKNPANLKLCALLDKPSRRVVDVEVDYIGFTIPDTFIVGYGLDYKQNYRNIPYVGEVKL